MQTSYHVLQNPPSANACLSVSASPESRAWGKDLGTITWKQEWGNREGRQGKREPIQGCITKLVAAKSPGNCVLGQSIREEEFICWVSYWSKVITQRINFSLQLAVAQKSPECLMGQHQQRSSRVRGRQCTVWGEGLSSFTCIKLANHYSGGWAGTSSQRSQKQVKPRVSDMAHVKASDTMTSDLTISPTSFSFTYSTHTDFDISKHTGLLLR